MRHAPTSDDKVMLNFLTESGFPFIAVLTKCDKLKPTERKKQSEFFSSLTELKSAKGIFECSAETGEGIDRLKSVLEDTEMKEER